MTGRTRQEQVQRMHRNGYTALEIAGQLNIPLPEVIAVIGSQPRETKTVMSVTPTPGNPSRLHPIPAMRTFRCSEITKPSTNGGGHVCKQPV